MGAWKMTLRNFGIVVLKNAVAAVLTNAGLMAMLSGAFNVTTRAGWWNIGKAAVAVIASREAAVFIPKLLSWSQTPEGALQERLIKAEAATKEAVVATKVAESAVSEAKSIAPPKP